jgi:hypothetical protein
MLASSLPLSPSRRSWSTTILAAGYDVMSKMKAGSGAWRGQGRIAPELEKVVGY